MKNLTSLLVIALMLMMGNNNANAQTVNQGAWMIGGSLGFSTWKYKDDNSSFTWFNFAPDAAYFFMDDFGAGLELDYVSLSYDGNSSSSFFFSPFVRYYVTDPFFAQLSYGFELEEGGGSLFSIGAGYSWFISNSVAIEPLLFYDIYGNEGDSDDYTEFGLAISLQIFLNRE